MKRGRRSISWAEPHRFACLLAAVLSLVVGGCIAGVPRPGGGRVEYGMASWYGADFHGRRTANGEIYDMYAMTAAHKTLPLGSRVRVTNRRNGRSVVVRINDRGPFVRGRIIDLSLAAARALDMEEEGVAPVRLEVLSLGDNAYRKSPHPAAVYTVQVGSFLKRENAMALKARLEPAFSPVFVREWNDGSRTYYRVRVGRLRTESAARRLARRLQSVALTPFVTAEQ